MWWKTWTRSTCWAGNFINTGIYFQYRVDHIEESKWGHWCRQGRFIWWWITSQPIESSSPGIEEQGGLCPPSQPSIRLKLFRQKGQPISCQSILWFSWRRRICIIRFSHIIVRIVTAIVLLVHKYPWWSLVPWGKSRRHLLATKSLVQRWPPIQAVKRMVIHWSQWNKASILVRDHLGEPQICIVPPRAYQQREGRVPRSLSPMNRRFQDCQCSKEASRWT